MTENILDIPGGIFLSLSRMLSDQNTMETFLKAVPHDYFSADLQLRMKIARQGLAGSMPPAETLLFELGNRGINVSTFINWLEQANLETILLLLKDDEPIQITSQPPPFIKVQEGSDLKIICKATSFPSPEYQWFKEDEELLLQQEPELLVSSIRLQNAGYYSCRIYTRNTKTGSLSYLFSDSTEVVVIPAALPPCRKMSELKPDDVRQQRTASMDDRIKIVIHPRSPGMVAQGSTILLNCLADSKHSVKYEWFCDGRSIDGATSAELKLENLLPDTTTGNTRWEYQCKVYSDIDFVFSHSAVVTLKEADDAIPLHSEEKLAFLLANDAYENLEDLKSPGNDVAVLAELLSSMGFKIFALRNLNLAEMKNALCAFCKTLKPNAYALFYFAGHGFELHGQTYLQPVDCSNKCIPDKSLCVQYILQCMQDKLPALNVMLIDTCRKLPEISSPPGTIFPAPMKRNTVYGYSTSFLCGSHERDGEQNGFFVKYLKKYITQERMIQDILYAVQKEFETDPMVQGKQYPLITSTLTTPRKLTDPVIEKCESIFDRTLSWADIRSSIHKDVEIYLGKGLGSSLYLEFHHNMNVFCNGIDVCAYIKVGENAPLENVQKIELDINFPTEQVHVLRTTNADSELKRGFRNALIKKEALYVCEKVQDLLQVEILLLIQPTRQILKKLNFPINTSGIAQLELFMNQLHSVDAINKKTSTAFKTHDGLRNWNEDLVDASLQSVCFSTEENI